MRILVPLVLLFSAAAGGSWLMVGTFQAEPAAQIAESATSDPALVIGEKPADDPSDGYALLPAPPGSDASGFGLRRNLLWLPAAVPVGEPPVDTGPAGT